MNVDRAKTLIGRTLGPYRLTAHLGTGGMGEVYKAHDPRLGREVAIKVMRDRLDAEALARFEREARAVAALSHPNVLAIFDVGTDDGCPYLVTELLEGESLRAALGRGAMSSQAVMQIGRQIAAALTAVHARNLVHRDLKPENVFLLVDNRVKLLDFGIAKDRPATAAVAADTATMFSTAAGTLLGTSGYMSPEQARGLECDARSDIFSLGAVLYEMLSGQRAFSGPTPLDTLTAVLTIEPPPFRTADAVPAALDALVRRALAKSPAARFASAAQIERELEQITAGGEAATAMVPVASSTAPSLAVLPFADLSPAHDHEYFCDGMAEEILDGLARVSGLRVASGSASFRFRGRGVDVREAAAALGVGWILEGSVRTADRRLRASVRLTHAGDGHVAWSQTFDRDLSDIFAVQDEIARAVVDALEVRLGTVPSRLIRTSTERPDAYALYLKGRHHWSKRTAASLDESISCFEQALNVDPQFARARAGLADACSMQAIYGFRAPAVVMPRARMEALTAIEGDSRLPEAHVALGVVRAAFEWSWAAAEADFQRALALAPESASALQAYANYVLSPSARFDEAIALLTRALATDPVSLPLNLGTGVVQLLADRTTESVATFERTLALDQHFAPGHFFLAGALAESGDFERALFEADQAAMLSAGPEMVGVRGYVLARSGRRDDALATVAELDARAAATYVSPGLAAQIYAGLDDETNALRRLHAACDVHAADMVWLAVRPAYRRLRSHPEFIKLVARLGLGSPPD